MTRLPLVMPLTLLCEFVLQEIVNYISHSLQEKKLLYFGMESLDFNFIDPVSIESVVSYSYLHHLIISISKMNTWLTFMWLKFEVKMPIFSFLESLF